MLEKQSGLFPESTPKADGLTSARTFSMENIFRKMRNCRLLYMFFNLLGVLIHGKSPEEVRFQTHLLAL